MSSSNDGKLPNIGPLIERVLDWQAQFEREAREARAAKVRAGGDTIQQAVMAARLDRIIDRLIAGGAAKALPDDFWPLPDDFRPKMPSIMGGCGIDYRSLFGVNMARPEPAAAAVDSPEPPAAISTAGPAPEPSLSAIDAFRKRVQQEVERMTTRKAEPADGMSFHIDVPSWMPAGIVTDWINNTQASWEALCKEQEAFTGLVSVDPPGAPPAAPYVRHIRQADGTYISAMPMHPLETLAERAKVWLARHGMTIRREGSAVSISLEGADASWGVTLSERITWLACKAGGVPIFTDEDCIEAIMNGDLVL